ncbi:MAG: monovalent cation/H(+) antiporter subunit G [Bowdeniella nasicola]|nr:monovalent cation/H(+) antiporter subunit G [Bowdeniella nasicola]
MNWTSVAELIGAVLLFLGAILVVVAAVGLLRFDDLLKRMHAAAKPQTLGTMLVMLGLALVLRVPTTIWALALVVAFVLVTSPVSAILASRAGFRIGHAPTRHLLVDDYSRDMRRAQIAQLRRQQAEAQRVRHDGDV